MRSEGSEDPEGLSISNISVSQSASESGSIIRARDASASKNGSVCISFPESKSVLPPLTIIHVKLAEPRLSGRFRGSGNTTFCGNALSGALHS